MNANELRKLLQNGALNAYSALYTDTGRQTQRMLAAIDSFEALYGTGRDIALFSVPGRSEISGNHTDHNRGCVLAGAIDRDIIAVAARNGDGKIRLRSEGYPEDTVDLSLAGAPENFRRFSSCSLIAGIADGFSKAGYAVGGWDAYTTTEVLKGSGISSSAAFEVMVGNIMNHFYNGGAVENSEIAKMAQYSENTYFGKPCGLMDQMACAVGGFVYIDFADPQNPVVEPINFSLTGAGYSLCIVNTGGNHANLNEDYASVPAEMKAVAAFFGRPVLRGLTEEEIVGCMGNLRRSLQNDRAILRALHFVRENERVARIRDALRSGDIDGFLNGVLASGRSSFEYLQNVYTTKNPGEQGLSLALAVTESVLSGEKCAWRVHGGGFAGTVQAFVTSDRVDEYCRRMDSVFGEGAAMRLRIRPVGAVKLFG